MAVNLSLVLHTLYKTLRQNTCCPTFLRAKALQGHETVGETHHHPPDTNLLLVRCTIAQLCPAVFQIVANMRSPGVSNKPSAPPIKPSGLASWPTGGTAQAIETSCLENVAGL